MNEPDRAEPAKRPALPLTLITRLDCQLCDDFYADLSRWLGGRAGYELAVVNVDSNPALIARYGLRVPLLVAGEVEICALRFTSEKLSELTSIV